MCAYVKTGHEPTSEWDGMVMNHPVHIRLFTRKFNPSAVDKEGPDNGSKARPNDILGAFGGVDSRAQYSELWFSATWKLNGKKITRTERTRILNPGLGPNNGHDGVKMVPSQADDSILVVVTCGDSVVERVSLCIPLSGHLSRHIVEVRS
ncbi:MAG: hypothetical protein JWO94_3773 [Verrucomicrobiaceae bacterium]|nr:hypothetical protein [Verrucomicrobiaceae bacterium]